MIKVAICDDENMIASQIDNMILTICQKENISVDTDVFYGGSSLEKEMLSGSYDRFIRTTDADHEKQVQKIFKKL